MLWWPAIYNTVHAVDHCVLNFSILVPVVEVQWRSISSLSELTFYDTEPERVVGNATVALAVSYCRSAAVAQLHMSGTNSELFTASVRIRVCALTSTCRLEGNKKNMYIHSALRSCSILQLRELMGHVTCYVLNTLHTCPLDYSPRSVNFKEGRCTHGPRCARLCDSGVVTEVDSAVTSSCC